jgi:drug/metabolite transporter (DMT)-like permease
MSIALGLGAAIAWGLADFGARFATQRVGNFRAFLYMQIVGWAMLSLWLVLNPPEVEWQWPVVGVAALIGVANTLGGLALYRAFQIGLLSVVAPIAACSGIIILPLGLISGQKISPFQVAGLLILIVGVMLASTPLRMSRAKPAHFNLPEKRFRGVGLALLSATFFGLAFWGLSFVTPTLGGIVPVWESRLIGPFLTVIVGRAIGQNLQLPGWQVLPLIIVVGVLDTGAFVLYTLGVASPQGAIAAVISSLFSAVTVLLARVFLREKLATNQWAGVLLILWGVILVGTN